LYNPVYKTIHDRAATGRAGLLLAVIRYWTGSAEDGGQVSTSECP
jgi:hypothetical protein